MKGVLLILAVTLFTICVVTIIIMAILTALVDKKNKEKLKRDMQMKKEDFEKI